MTEAFYMPGWATETLHPELRLSLCESGVVLARRSALQDIRVFENKRFGRVLTLDGAVQLTEGDEFIYHEMVAHGPLLSHGNARRVLIVGGGDGGLAREVLRHHSIERVVLVEIDPAVVEVARTELPTVAAGAFADPRLELVIADGAAFLTDESERFDLILVDAPDPTGPGAALFAEEFHAKAARRLAPEGIIVAQSGMPFMQADELRAVMRSFRGIFSDAACYLATVPSYSGGAIAFAWGSNGTARSTTKELLDRRYAAATLETRYFTPDVFRAAFVLPPYVAAIAEDSERLPDEPAG